MAAPQSYVTNYVPALIRAGLSANQSLLYLRGEWENLTPESREKLGAANISQLAEGLSPRRETYLKIHAQVAASLGRREQVISAPLTRTPNADEISEFAAKRPGGYLFQTLVAVQRPGTGEVYLTPSAYFTPELVTYEEALQQAVDVYVDAQEDHGSFEGERILGGVPTGVYSFVPE